MNQYIGAYQIVDLVGAGGMGEVYRAIHNKIGRVVALKVLNHSAHNPQSMTRFLNEARIQAGLHHPNIATLYDCFDDRGRFCIVMEFVDGQTLEDRIRTSGFLKSSEAERIFIKIVDAVRYIHEKGIVHRDIKPNNIRITASGDVKLLDFGIAREVASDRLTRVGSFVGTLQYLAPEQLLGGKGDSRSDIWSLGVLLYEMLTGSLPFDPDSISDYMAAVDSTSFSGLEGTNLLLADDIARIIRKCLAKKPGQRYQSASELLEDFSECSAEGKKLQCNKKGTVYRPFSDSRSWLFGVAASVLVPLLTVGLFLSDHWVNRNGHPESRRQFVPTETPGPAPPTSMPGSRNHAPLLIETSQDLPAEVYIDGVKVGETPFKSFETIGREFELTIKRNCHRNITKAIRITPTNNQYKYTLPRDLCNS